jgi:hypothetical protein
MYGWGFTMADRPVKGRDRTPFPAPSTTKHKGTPFYKAGKQLEPEPVKKKGKVDKKPVEPVKKVDRTKRQIEFEPVKIKQVRDSKAKTSLFDLVMSTRRFDAKRVERTPYIDIEIANVIPYFGTSSILFTAKSTSGTSPTLQYPTVIAFYNIEFLNGEKNWKRGMLKFENPATGETVVCKQPSYRRSPVRVYCACFTGDTKISLLNGTEVPIKDLVGLEEFWIYSCTPQGKIVPGRGHTAHKTKKNAKVIKITLDNGKVIKCTPDHLFMLKNGSYKEAKDLNIEDSLMPLQQTMDHKIVKIEDAGYEDVYCFSVDNHHNYALSSGVFVHNCPDYYFVFAYQDFNKQCYYGRKPKPYKRVSPPSGLPPRNPKNIIGLCKHLINMVNLLIKEGYIK